MILKVCKFHLWTSEVGSVWTAQEKGEELFTRPLLCSEFLIAFSGSRHTRFNFVWGTTFWQLAGSMHGHIRTQKTWTTVFLLCILALSKFNEAQPSYCLVGTMRAQGVPTRSLVALLCGLGAINAVAVKMASKAPFTKAWVLGLGVVGDRE